MGLANLIKELLSKLNNEYKQSMNLGEGVVIHTSKTDEIIFENHQKYISFILKDSSDRLIGIQEKDIDYMKVDLLENAHNAHTLRAKYGFAVERFINGVALVWWTLYPDGRYFEDEDGHGGENCDETTVYAFMDPCGRIIIPFQDMNQEERQHFRSKAESIVLK